MNEYIDFLSNIMGQIKDNLIITTVSSEDNVHLIKRPSN